MSDSTFKYVATGVLGTWDTRHEAIGQVAKHGVWERDDIVPISENCLIRPMRGPTHIGDEHYGDRDYVATTHGAVRINHESLVRHWNGAEQEVVESHWEADCPVCYRTHTSDDGSEAARSDLFDTVLACCGAEWFPPSDWVADCEFCGDDHRGEFGCAPPGLRDPRPDLANPVDCGACGWDGDGGDLDRPHGNCPKCGSAAVVVRSEPGFRQARGDD